MCSTAPGDTSGNRAATHTQPGQARAASTRLVPACALGGTAPSQVPSHPQEYVESAHATADPLDWSARYTPVKRARTRGDSSSWPTVTRVTAKGRAGSAGEKGNEVRQGNGKRGAMGGMEGEGRRGEERERGENGWKGRNAA